MSWFSDLFMSSKEKADRERKRKALEQADANRRWLEGRKRKEKLIEEQQRMRSLINRGEVATIERVREDMGRAEQRKKNQNQSDDDLLNPLNPLSPISPISIWNTNDDNHRHDHRSDDHHHHSNDHHSHSSNDDYSSSHSHDSSSYDSSSYDSGDSGGGDSGGGGD